VAAAYAEADGGPTSNEMRLLRSLDRYGGAANVLGRVLGAGEIRRMNAAQNICNWYAEREAAENMVEWTESNPQKAETLNLAHKFAVEFGLIEE
jgi:hypothetical protein